jgi:hypothetical protein
MLIPFCVSQVSGKTLVADVTFYEDSSPPVVEEITLIDSENSMSYYQAGEPYEVSLGNEKGDIWRKSIPISFNVIYQERRNGSYGSDTVNEKQERLLMPLYLNATHMKFYYSENMIKKVSIPERICKSQQSCSRYCSGKEANLGCTCGDNVCQEDLNERELCPQDCSQSSDTTKDVDEQDQSDSGNLSEGVDQPEVVDSGTNTGILVIIGILALIGAVILASSKVKIEA